MRSRRSRKGVSSPPAAGDVATDPIGSAGMSGSTRRTSPRTAASAATRSAAATGDGAQAKSKSNTTVAMAEEQRQASKSGADPPGRRSANTRKRTRTTFYNADVGTEKATGGSTAKADGAAEAAATGGAASRSSENQSDTAGGAISDKSAKASGDSNGGKAQKASANIGATVGRTSRLSLTKRRAARAQAQAKTKAQTQTKKKEDQVQVQPSPGRAKGQKYRVGIVISKDFDGVAYRGDIISYDAKARYYKVRYVEDGDEEELEEAEIERFLDPLDCSSDADSSIAVSITATAGKKSSADESAMESKDVAAAKPEGKTRGATAAAAAQEDAVTAKSTGRGKGDEAAATKDGPKKNQAIYPIGTEISKDFDGVAYRGEVVSYDEGSKFYKIRYSDGDEEEMDAKDMRVHVVQSTGTKTDDTGAATKNDDDKKSDGKKAGTKIVISSEISVKVGDDAGAGAKKGGRKKISAKEGDAKKAASSEVSGKIDGGVGTSDSAGEHSGASSGDNESQKASESSNKGERSKGGKKSDTAVEASKPSDPPVSSRDDILRAATQLAATKTPVSATSTSPSTCTIPKKSDGGMEEKETFHPGHVCRDAQFYTTLNDETPFDCSEKLGCECNDLLSANRKRYKRLNAKSKLQQGTILRIPEKRDIEKVLQLYKYKDGEPKLDYCYVCLEIESPDGPEMLLCDGDSCDKACHLSCTHDKLNTVPDGDWHCKSCQDKSSTSISSKPKKKRSKLKRVPKASRSKGSGTRISASSSTPNLSSVRPVTPASYDVMDSLAFLGQSTAPASALASAPLPSKSRSTKSKQKQKQTKSPPRPKTPKDQESILSSPANLPSKKLLAVLDGQVVEDSTTSDNAHVATTTERSPPKKRKGAAATASKKKKREKNKDNNNSTPMDSIALTVEEEFKQFERARLKGERQTIVLRIRRLKEEITTLQDHGKAAAAKKGGEKSESALSRTKKITWKQLELKNLQGEEKRLANRLDELSENASSLPSTIEEGDGSDASVTAKPSSSNGKAIKKKKAQGSTNGKKKKENDNVASDAPTKATAADASTVSGIDAKKRRSSSTKSGQKKRKQLPGSSDDEDTESDDKPKTKAKKAKTSAKKISTKKGLSDIQRKRDQARRKRKQLKLSRRSSKSSSAEDNDDDSDEDYSQVWVNNDANDSDDHNLPPDMSSDEAPTKKKKRQSRRQSGSSTGRGRGSKPRWLPCGSCLGCIQTKDCGRCRSCLERPSEATNVRSTGGFQRFICIQRQCLAPTHRRESSGNGDDVDMATPTPPPATDVSSAGQEKELPQLSGGVKRKNMPALGGVKTNSSPPIQPEVPIVDGKAQPRISEEEHLDEIESLSDGGEGMFNMSDLEDDDDDEALGLNIGVGRTLNAALVDMAPPPLHEAALPPVPQQVTVPSPLRGKEAIAGAMPSHSIGDNAAQMARDLRRRDRLHYEDDDADEWSSVGGSLGSHGGDEMMELPPL